MTDKKTTKSGWRPRDAEATKRALIAAGEELFAAHGVKGATVKAIADLAGVNKAMVSYYFGGKAGLYLAIIEDVVNSVLAAYPIAPDTDADPREMLADHIYSLGDIVRVRPAFGPMLLREYLDDTTKETPRIVERISGFYMRTKAILEAGESRGVFRPTDAHMTHLSIVGSLIFFFTTMRVRVSMRKEGGWGAEADLPGDGFIRHVQAMILTNVSAAGEDRDVILRFLEKRYN